MKNLKSLFRYIGNYKGYFYLSLVLSATSSILLLTPYYSMYHLFLSISSGSNFQSKYYGWIAIVGVLVGVLCYFLSLWFSHMVGFRVERNMRLFGGNQLLEVSLSFFDTHESGKIRKIIDDNAALTHSFVAHNIPDLVSTCIVPIFVVGVLLKLNWVLGVICLCTALLSLYLVKKMMGDPESLQYYMIALNNITSEATEFIRGMQIVKIFNASLDNFRTFKKSIDDYSDWALKYSFSARLSYVLNRLVLEVLPLILIAVAYPVMSKHPSISLFLVNIMFCMVFGSQLLLSLTKILNTGTNYALAFQSIHQLENLFDGYLEHKPTEHQKITSCSITCNAVTFSYTPEKQALKDVTFSIPEKSTTAVIGASGSGKSTIAKLIANMYHEYEGEIKIGSYDLNAYPEETLMDTITYVSQNAQLFHKSILENLKMARPTATTEEIQQALIATECSELIQKLPDGVETIIGTGGVHLSGGERQRLVLCQAFLKNNPIIILDEVTASVDPENEFKLMRAIESLSRDKTVIMIAHKLSLVEKADQILVFKTGELVEKGTPQQLKEKQGIYYNMLQRYHATKRWTLKGEVTQ
ncbi:ABC transporter ATP-binding protein [Vagococcus entomophilus]|uniref:ABC transporter ATP-binding protein n=1 Tax=Vagococcus entomophilus TaxID=1160095 RepID=A0A430AFD2_9ENTE|nr:ABC transporter ATP-binding protein [Vagococcus entomophilus]RSU06429.1 hypothetical protein CBF30_09245 [Vagococcus entomophilus]